MYSGGHSGRAGILCIPAGILAAQDNFREDRAPAHAVFPLRTVRAGIFQLAAETVERTAVPGFFDGMLLKADSKA